MLRMRGNESRKTQEDRESQEGSEEIQIIRHFSNGRVQAEGSAGARPFFFGPQPAPVLFPIPAVLGCRALSAEPSGRARISRLPVFD
jgi:hypothetical protein